MFFLLKVGVGSVKFKECQRFQAAKRVLRETHQLPSHFSCSHSLLWSALRYGHIATPRKPDVDETPWIWTPAWSGFSKDCKEVDLFDLSQRPYRADDWRKQKQVADTEASKAGMKTTFAKHDLKALIIAKHLYNKDSLLSFIQDHGTTAMQIFASNHQRKLTEYIEDAEEWATAKQNAAFAAISDWDLLCQARAKPCPHGDDCGYKKSVAEIFHLNSSTVSRSRLAFCLREIMQKGPAKHIRIPFLVGPSNSGKSTLLYPLDDLMGPRYVFHKPALGSTFALRNITKKRFIFWDDYGPVEYAAEKTVSKSLFLSLFIGKNAEVQVSQSFNDGNMDVQWKRGVAFTCKLDGLWTPAGKITQEDVNHMRNRCEEFYFYHVFSKEALKEVDSCCHHFAEWVIDGANEYDAACRPAAVTPNGGQAVPLAASSLSEEEPVKGFKELMQFARIPDEVQQALATELDDMGAVDVKELLAEDWKALTKWPLLKSLQQRRLLQHVVGPQRE